MQRYLPSVDRYNNIPIAFAYFVSEYKSTLIHTSLPMLFHLRCLCFAMW